MHLPPESVVFLTAFLAVDFEVVEALIGAETKSQLAFLLSSLFSSCQAIQGRSLHQFYAQCRPRYKRTLRGSF